MKHKSEPQIPDARTASEPFLVFGQPDLHEEDIEEVVAALRSGWIGTGPRVGSFTQAFLDYVGGSNGLALNSCTSSLHLALLGAGIGPGDEVITTPLTFCATVNAIVHVGATPVLADVDCESMNLDPGCIRERVTTRTKAILPVHFAGRPCNMGEIMDIARAYRLAVIEDCAHAIEAKWQGRHVGTIGDFGSFSFYVTKNVTTGEGGMLVGRDSEAVARLRILSLHGLDRHAWNRFGPGEFRHYEVVECGYKYNMSDIQAAVGIHQLRRIEASLSRREDIWKIYQDALGGSAAILPGECDAGDRHARHLYTIQIDEHRRDQFLAGMTSEGIGVGVHYMSLPEHRFYRRRFGWRPEDYPNARAIGRRTASLPLSAKLTDSDVERVISAARRQLSR